MHLPSENLKCFFNHVTKLNKLLSIPKIFSLKRQPVLFFDISENLWETQGPMVVFWNDYTFHIKPVKEPF